MKNPVASKFAEVLMCSEMTYPVILSIEIKTETINEMRIITIMAIFPKLNF